MVNTNIYSGISSPNQVGVFDSVGNTLITNIALAAAPSTAATETPDGTKIYVGALAPTQDIYAVSTVSNTVTATISTAPHNVEDQACSNNAFAYFPLQGANLGIVNAATNVLTVLALGAGQVNFLAITPNGRFVYAPTVGSNQVQVIDTTTNTITATIATGAGSNPITVMTTADGNWAYVGDENLAQVYKISTATQTIAATIAMPAIQVGGYVFSIDATTANVYAGAPSSNALYVISVASNTVIHTLATTAPHPEFGVTINNNKTYGYTDADGTHEGYVTNASPVSLTSINLAPLHTGPGAVTPNGLRLFVGDTSSGSITVVDTTSITVVTTIADSGASTLWVLGQYFPTGPPPPAYPGAQFIPKLFIPIKGKITIPYTRAELKANWMAIEIWSQRWLPPPTTNLLFPHKDDPTPEGLTANWFTFEVWGQVIQNLGAPYTPLFVPRKNSTNPTDLDIDFLAIERWANRLPL